MMLLLNSLQLDSWREDTIGVCISKTYILYSKINKRSTMNILWAVEIPAFQIALGKVGKREINETVLHLKMNSAVLWCSYYTSTLSRI